MRILPRILCALAIIGLVYWGCAETVRLTSVNDAEKYQQTPTVQLAAAQELIVIPYGYHECERTKFKLTYYNPLRGGINCDDDCTRTANGTRIIGDDGNTISEYWFDGKKGGVACPPKYPFGTVFVIPGYDIQFVCIDRGGRIVVEDGVVILDILYDDGKRKGDNGYDHPKASDGTVLSGIVDGYVYSNNCEIISSK
ncbi:MAG: hypothetical protein QXM68_02280 [Candidatus Aenigmatarchaeota archaeon]|nr:hypothetical protein [Candidatus Aenigmarchaeota archaeon]